MQKFLTLVAQVAILVGLVIAAVHFLHLPPEIAAYAVLVGAGVVALVALVGILQRLPLSGLRLPRRAPKGPAVADARSRAKTMRAQLRAGLRQLMGTRWPVLAKESLSKPWWLVVGPTAAGKSTLIAAARHAACVGLPDGSAPRITEASDVVFVEFDPDFGGSGGGAELQEAFVKEVARWRPGQPVHGVLVVLREGTPPAEIERTRDYLRELIDRFQVQVPIVTVVTHLDRLPGFLSFYRGLEGKGRAVGVVFPPRETPSKIEESARDQLMARDGALAWVQRRCYALMARYSGHEVDILGVHAFGEAFGERSTTAAQWLRILASEPILGGESIQHRGLVFTGRDPEGASEGLLFAEELLSTMLPRDAQYATRSRVRETRRSSWQRVIAVGVVGIGCLVVAATAQSARANRELLNKTLAAAAPLLAEGALAAPDEVEALRGVAETWRAPEIPDGHGLGLFRADLIAPALSGAFSRVMCHRVLGPLVLRSRENLRRFARSFRDASPGSAAQAQAIDDLRYYMLLSRPSAESPGSKAEEVPAPWDSEETEWLLGASVARWGQSVSISTSTCSACRSSFLLYRDLVEVGPRQPVASESACDQSGGRQAIERDPQLVAEIREILQSGSAESIEYDAIIAAVNQRRELPTLSLNDVAGSTRLEQRRDLTIERAFTGAGWVAVGEAISARLNEEARVPRWLLKTSTIADNRRQRCRQLRQRYVGEYKAVWVGFLRNIYIARPGSLEEAEQILAALSGEGIDDRPLSALFKLINGNTWDLPPISCAPRPTRVTQRAPAEIDRLTSLFGTPRGGIIGPSIDRVQLELMKEDGRDDSTESVAREFASIHAFTSGADPTKLGTYHEIIQKLWQQTAAANGSGQRDELKPELDADLRKIRDLVRDGDLGTWKKPMEGILIPPVEGIDPIVKGQEHCAIVREWCEAVAEPLRAVTGLYPFVRGNEESTTLKSVAALLHPETGAVAVFRNTHLVTDMIKQGDTFVRRESGREAKNALTQSAVDFFNEAHTLGLLLFPRNGEALAEFELVMRCAKNAANVELDVDGTPYGYKCDSRDRRSARWPGGDAASAKLSVTGKGIPTTTLTARGDFAFLELLERDGSPRRDGKSIALTFGLVDENHGQLTMTITPILTSGGTIFYGRGDGDEFLAPFRARALRSPPMTLFSDVGPCCPSGGAR